MDESTEQDRPESHPSHEASDLTAESLTSRLDESRTDAGWFKPNNPGGPGAPLVHGGRSKRVAAGLMPEQAEGRAALTERVAAIVADLGGSEALTALASGMVERHARLVLVDDFLFANLQRLGPLTGKGRTRAALTAWLAVVDRLQKSAMALGLERKARKIPSLAEVMASDD
jgi:hypothetical protein